MSTRVVGIDPGNQGALALFVGGRLAAIEDMPCVADGTKGRRPVNAALLAAILRGWQPDAIYAELIGLRPTDAKVAAFAFGRCWEMAGGKAIRRCPLHAGLFSRVRDDWRAEAALIALAGMEPCHF